MSAWSHGTVSAGRTHVATWGWDFGAALGAIPTWLRNSPKWPVESSREREGARGQTPGRRVVPRPRGWMGG